MIIALICVTTFTNCSVKETKADLRLVETELGGCNLEGVLKNAVENEDSEINDFEEDKVIVTITNESVRVFVGFNYTCKGIPFETKNETIGDVLCMYIIDTCGDGDCYHRCPCYYTFNFIFSREGTKTVNQKYKIVLIDPRKEEHVILSEGVIEN